jgi:hypothetical protein
MQRERAGSAPSNCGDTTAPESGVHGSGSTPDTESMDVLPTSLGGRSERAVALRGLSASSLRQGLSVMERIDGIKVRLVVLRTERMPDYREWSTLASAVLRTCYLVSATNVAAEVKAAFVWLTVHPEMNFANFPWANSAKNPTEWLLTKHAAVVEQLTTERDEAIEKAEKICNTNSVGFGPVEARAECSVTIDRVNAKYFAAVERVEAERYGAIERAFAERDAVRAAIVSAEAGINALVNAPVSGGRDPTEWLPDELIVMIMIALPFDVLWSGVCRRVCRRWARLMESAPIKRRKRDGRWMAYTMGVIEPRLLEGYTSDVNAIALGLDGKLFTASSDTTIRVWSNNGSTHLQTLQGHWHIVTALAVGLDGKLFSGSYDMTIRVWSGVDGTHLQTLVGHAERIRALAVGLDGKLYSGSNDRTIRVWSTADGTHLQTLVGHAGHVRSLAVGLDGKVYSGSSDRTIRVWSGDNGAHAYTLEGHTSVVSALCVGINGKVYSGSWDGSIRAWSGADGAHLQIIAASLGDGHVEAMAVGRDGKIYVSVDEREIGIAQICVFRSSDGARLPTLTEHRCAVVRALALMPNGRLLSGGLIRDDEEVDDDGRSGVIMVW